MSKLLEGKSGFVTGAANGIGRGIAIELAKEGASVVVSDLERMRSEALDTVQTITATGGSARFIPADVTLSADVEHLVQSTSEAFGRLDFAVNNAGIGPLSPLADFAESTVNAVIDVNFKGVYFGLKHEIQAFRAAGVAGSIVNIASVAGQVPVRNLGIYTATKHAVIGLTKSAALEYGADGVRVNAVLPNAIRTPLLEAAPKEFQDGLIAPQAIKRFGEPEEVGAAVAFLLSDRAAFITGAGLPIDGGYLLGK